MTHGSLFTGIGGFDLAALWAGIPTLWQVEIDPWCRQLLAKRFPNAKQYGDIRTVDHLPHVDVITGGFPCQPFSIAGKRGGKQDDRFLWPEMLRVISTVKPAWVIGENVAGFINMGLDQAIIDLAGIGYEAQSFIIPACAVNADHQRKRLWIVAHTKSSRQQERNSTNVCHRVWKPSWLVNSSRLFGEIEPVICRGDDGISRGLDGYGERIHGLGNAIVPQVAYRIMSAIKEIEEE